MLAISSICKTNYRNKCRGFQIIVSTNFVIGMTFFFNNLDFNCLILCLCRFGSSMQCFYGLLKSSYAWIVIKSDTKKHFLIVTIKCLNMGFFFFIYIFMSTYTKKKTDLTCYYRGNYLVICSSYNTNYKNGVDMPVKLAIWMIKISSLYLLEQASLLSFGA